MLWLRAKRYQQGQGGCLQDRHGIELREVAGCMVDRETTQHMTAYNAIMKAEISRRFGADMLEKTAEEAQRIHP